MILKIAVIFVPSIKPINHVNVCGIDYFAMHFYKQYYSNNTYDISIACLLLHSVNVDSFIQS